MSTTTPQELASITTREQVNSEIAKGTSLAMLLEHSTYFRSLSADRLALEQAAVPLYKEQLSSVPFYGARMNDEQFWSAYVGSRVVAARELVASKAASTKA